MQQVAAIPNETDVLCEGCGYVLNGLPPGGNCPECGKPTAESAATLRRPPVWEQGPAAGNVLLRFLRTSAHSIFRPADFFRNLSAVPSRSSRRFAALHWLLSAVLIGSAIQTHATWSGVLPQPGTWDGKALQVLSVIGLWLVATAALNELAARLTAWEAAYRGLRLPLPTVRRAMDYHSAHYLPVALGMAAIVFAYQFLLRRDYLGAMLHATTYLYVLCAAVVLAAFYLFKTYWAGMRNLMYANR